MIMTESSVQQIQQRLTCPVCLDRYKTPKLLPCQHTFCLTPCLTNLLDRTTRKIKCPECRMLHALPINGGIEAFPNNITILRFLDVDFSSKINSSHSSSVDDNTICIQCNKKHEPTNLIKCLDCEKFVCNNCRLIHMIQLKNEAKQSLVNLRRMLPKLSEKVGNYEQKKIHINQNAESIKRDVTLVIERLIEDLKNRERCLHAEAEVYMQSQIRTIGLEKENAEIELASVSSFCDSAEIILNKVDQNNQDTNENNNGNNNTEIAMTKKQCKIFIEQMNTLNEQQSSFDINKVCLVISDLNDLSEYIKNFGLLTVSNNNNTSTNTRSHRTPPYLTNNPNLETNQFLARRDIDLSNNTSINLNTQRPTRQTWNLNETDLNDLLPYFNENTQNGNTSARNVQQHQIQRRNRSNQERPIFGGGNGGGNSETNNRHIHNNRSNANVPRPIGFNINLNNIDNVSNNNNRSNQNNSVNVVANNNNDIRSSIRSNTFVLDNQNQLNNEDESLIITNRSTELNALYNVRRARRARTPMTFNVMLDEPLEPLTNLFNENGPEIITNSDTSVTSTQATNNNSSIPTVNYSSKKRAKLIIGKQGRDNGEFIWPIDIAFNQFNNQLLVSDSGNHRIQIFMDDGNFLKMFGKKGQRESQFDCVSGIFIDSMSNIFVVDRMNHRIQVFDRYSRFIRSIGQGHGTAPGQLNFPWGIAVNRLSEIFVCDKENDRISVFHLSGKFLRTFGTHGTNNGQFDKPYYIHITRENKLLVSDCSNHRIQIFETNGIFLHTFGREGTNPGEFKHPRGITTDSEGFILVADSGNCRVQVFRSDGQYVTHFGDQGVESGKFRGLEGLTCNSHGDVILCDKENHRIQIM